LENEISMIKNKRQKEKKVSNSLIYDEENKHRLKLELSNIDQMPNSPLIEKKISLRSIKNIDGSPSIKAKRNLYANYSDLSPGRGLPG
jgi:hypothetical protein